MTMLKKQLTLNKHKCILIFTLINTILGCRLPDPSDNVKAVIINNTSDTILVTAVDTIAKKENLNYFLDTMIININPIEFVIKYDRPSYYWLLCNSRQKLDTNTYFYKKRFDKIKQNGYYDEWDDSTYVAQCKYCITIDTSYAFVHLKFKLYPNDVLRLNEPNKHLFWDTIHFSWKKHIEGNVEKEYSIDLNGEQAILNVLHEDVNNNDVDLGYTHVLYLGGKEKSK